MTHWWSHNATQCNVFDEADKERIEDLTGCIPLLLEPFKQHGGKSLESLESDIWTDGDLGAVTLYTFQFAEHKKGAANQL